MVQTIKNISSVLLMLVVLFYSAGMAILVQDGHNEKIACSMKKGCTCCEMNKSKSSCCTGISGHSTGLNLPCNHPGMDGIHYKYEPFVKMVPDNFVFANDAADYHVFNASSDYTVEITPLLKPPSA